MAILNAAIIGLGVRSRAHLAVLPVLPDRYRLAGVCDIDAERAQAVADQTGAKAYTDLQTMLDSESLDVALIAAQPEIHHPIARMLAECRVHILSETPIAHTLPCADMMIRAAEDNGVFLEVSENARRWPRERLKQKIVSEGLIGNVREFYVSYTSGSYHGISAIRSILGSEPRSVSGTFPDAREVRERGVIRWSDTIGGTYEHNVERKNYWEVIGSDGAIRGMELNLYRGDRKLAIVSGASATGQTGMIHRSSVDTQPAVVWESPLKAYTLPDEDSIAVAEAWCSLYDAVVRGAALEYGAHNARSDIEVLMAVRESAGREGIWVDLPLEGMTDHEKRIHSAFEEIYGVDLLDLTPHHPAQRGSLPPRLRELLY
ncbi:MAG: Gfo/Idh/MocA family oxidoreductase [Gemmatimonadota bacterium]|nr:Gfo/Idh/MocA family oxidoreductase [Gemmatimonadota bacterium]